MLKAYVIFLHKTHQLFQISHVRAYRSTDQSYFGWQKIDRPLQKLIFNKVRMFPAILQIKKEVLATFFYMYSPISCHSDQIFSVDYHKIATRDHKFVNRAHKKSEQGERQGRNLAQYTSF